MKHLTVLFIIATTILSYGISVFAQESSPFGICAHLQGGEEHKQMPENLKLMRSAGIRWVRADFSWSGVESPQGNWKFDHLDRVVDETEKQGIQVLPILNYDVPWATPAYKHQELWLTYVEKVVSRYKNRIRHWEVWNEPNLEGFWRERPDGANYKLLLEATYKKIKSIDPNLVVLYGGTAGIPMPFIEKSFEAGAAKSFDIFNIHPYRGGMNSIQAVKRYHEELETLRACMARYQVEQKKIWITEMGWATPPEGSQTNRAVLAAAKKTLDPKTSTWTVAVLYDPNYPAGQAFSKNALLALLPENCRAEFITLPELKNIQPKKYQALLLPPSECYPTPFLDNIVNYVTRGGNLILFGGVPFYYRTEFSKEDPNLLVQIQGGSVDPDRARLRIGWQAWWTDKEKKTPEKAQLVPAPDVEQTLGSSKLHGQATRFLTNRLLKEGDQLIPILLGKEKEFEGICAGIFKFNSDMKGAVIVNTIMGEQVITTEADQAMYLPQAVLLSLRFGIERFFWYEFQAPEQDRMDKEHHFGIVHRHLDPKPAYHSYSALTKLYPEGSVMDMQLPWDQKDICTVSWTQPDGTRVWALWCPEGERKVSLRIGAGLRESLDHTGKTLSSTESTQTLTLGPEIRYFVGPKEIRIK